MQSINLFSPEFKAHAYPMYATLRETDPIYPLSMPDGQTAWLILRYDDSLAALRDVRFGKDPTRAFDINNPRPLTYEGFELISKMMLNADPPDHTRLRALVQGVFTPRMIDGLQGRIEEITEELLDEATGKEEMDLISEFAFPLPIIVISEMLGIPIEDRDRFRRWSHALISAANDPEHLRRIIPQFTEFTSYLRDLFEERRIDPKEDVISGLVHAEAEGDKLSEQELYSMVILLIIAGHETTVNLIGNGMYALFEHPDQFEKLKAKPQLMESAIEEMLRYYSPIEVTTNRWALEDVSLRGKTIAKGDMVLIIIASANRDPAQFENPDQFDITRKENRHLAFGLGIHFCLGAPLARLEGRIAFSALLRRLPNSKPAVPLDTLSWQPGLLLRGLTTLPVRL